MTCHAAGRRADCRVTWRPWLARRQTECEAAVPLQHNQWLDSDWESTVEQQLSAVADEPARRNRAVYITMIKTEVHRRRYCQLSWPTTLQFITLWASNSTESFKKLYAKICLAPFLWYYHFTVYVIACGLEKYVIFEKRLRLTGPQILFKFMCTHNVVHTIERIPLPIRL